MYFRGGFVGVSRESCTGQVRRGPGQAAEGPGKRQAPLPWPPRPGVGSRARGCHPDVTGVSPAGVAGTLQSWQTGLYSQGTYWGGGRP